MELQNYAEDTVESFDKCTNKKVVLSANAPISILNANPKRVYGLLVLNSPGSVTIILGEPSNGQVGGGIPIIGKGSNCTIKNPSLYTGKISAISATAVEISIVECERSY